MRNVICVVLGLILSVVLHAPAKAQIVTTEDMVAAVDAWFNDLSTFRSRFSQLAHSGKQSQGELLIERPDKIRLDYDRPSQLLIISNDGQLVYYDPAVNQQSYIDTEDTPLGLLLAPSVSIERDADIIDAGDNGELYWIKLSHKNPRLQGLLTLFFSKEPFQLKRWDVLDASNKQTRVVLKEVSTGLAIAEDRFIFRSPEFYGKDAND